MNNNHHNIEKSILETIVFFDIFNYPLTSFEIWKYLFGVRVDLGDLIEILESSSFLKKKLDRQDAYFFLKGRSNIVEEKTRHYLAQYQKIKILQKVIRKIYFLPGIQMVALCNNFFYQSKSDIDILIITKTKNIWMTRFFVVLILHLFNLRIQENDTENKICPSFFLSEDALDLENITLADDYYFYFWLVYLIPVYDPRNYYHKFLDANLFIKKKILNFQPRINNEKLIVENNILIKVIRKFLDVIFSFLNKNNILEKFLKNLQLAKMPKNLKKLAEEKNKKVIINDHILKFHENDRREYYRDLYIKKLDQVFLEK